MNPAAVVGLGVAGVGAALAASLSAYTITNHGENKLTSEAAANLIYCRTWIDKVVAALGGTLTSAYRSPTVNHAVGGSPTSDHMKGLAADVTPGKKHSVEAAFNLVRKWAEQTALDRAKHPETDIGPVRQIIWEPSWVHVGWYAPGKTGALGLLKKNGPDFVRIA